MYRPSNLPDFAREFSSMAEEEHNKELWEENRNTAAQQRMLLERLAGKGKDEIGETLGRVASKAREEQAYWEEKAGEKGGQPRLSFRLRLLTWRARLFGVKSVVHSLVRMKVQSISSYSRQFQQSEDTSTYRPVFKLAVTQALELARLEGSDVEEPWHAAAHSGGILREVVYGFNDGLTSNFGLIMGVIGSSATHGTVLLAGLAGLIADSLSMGASGFLAARSQEEVRQNQLAMESAEIRLVPEEEQKELQADFEGKGLTEEMAQRVAKRLLQSPKVALDELAGWELGLDTSKPQSAAREAVVTGIATGIGAAIPIIPFFFISGQAAIYAGLTVAMLFHYLVGMGRAYFTGRPAMRSGLEMFVVGMGVAFVAFALGLLLRNVI